MLYGIIYTNYDQNWLTEAGKLEISWDKYKRITFKRGQIVS